MQAQALRARDDLLSARQEVEARERHIQQLEQKLGDLMAKIRGLLPEETPSSGGGRPAA